MSSFLLGLYVGVEPLGQMVVTLSLIFEELPSGFPKLLPHFTISPAMPDGSKFSASLPTLVMVYFDSSHLCGCEVVS